MADYETIRLIESMAEEYKLMDPLDLRRNRKEKCMKCKWRGYLGGGSRKLSSAVICNWSLLNNKNFRDCLPMECKYFEPGERIKEDLQQLVIDRRYTDEPSTYI